MNFLKRLFKQDNVLLELEVSISDSSFCKVLSGANVGDFNIMLASLLVYARVLKIIQKNDRPNLINFFLQLQETSKATKMTIAELLNLVTNTTSSTIFKTRIKLIEQENGAKTIYMGNLYNTDLKKYAFLMFGFGLRKIDAKNHINLLSAFVTLSKICSERELTTSESIFYPYDILEAIVNSIDE